MDIISHGLYGGIAFGRKNWKDYLTAFFFGIGPDLFAFGPFFISMFLGLNPWPDFGKIEPPNVPQMPQYVHTSYDITHSFVIYALFFALLWFLGKRKFAKLTLGWPLHILVDMPLHSSQFFPTPFLWPVSHFHINGTPWGNPYIFIPNVIFIVVIYTYWYLQERKRKLSLKDKNY